jgi:hypothetical protein
MSKCVLTSFERKLYCSKKKVSESCRNPRFLGHRCPNLMWTKDDLIAEVQNGVKEIVSSSGFSTEALEYAKRYRPELILIRKNRIVKPKRRQKKKAALA